MPYTLKLTVAVARGKAKAGRCQSRVIDLFQAQGRWQGLAWPVAAAGVQLRNKSVALLVPLTPCVTMRVAEVEQSAAERGGVARLPLAEVHRVWAVSAQ